MDFNENKTLAEKISTNYFAMYGTFPEGYDIDLFEHPLCGISLDVAIQYHDPKPVRKMVKEIKDYYKNLPLEIGTPVSVTSGVYFKGNNYFILHKDGDMVLLGHPNQSAKQTKQIDIKKVKYRIPKKNEMDSVKAFFDNLTVIPEGAMVMLKGSKSKTQYKVTHSLGAVVAALAGHTSRTRWYHEWEVVT
jgi:hypothetical protein